MPAPAETALQRSVDFATAAGVPFTAARSGALTTYVYGSGFHELTVSIEPNRSIAAELEVRATDGTRVNWWLDTDLYPIDSDKYRWFGEAIEADVAALVNELARRRLLVGRSHQKLIVILPLLEEIRILKHGRLGTTSRTVAPNDPLPPGDYVPLQDWAG